MYADPSGYPPGVVVVTVYMLGKDGLVYSLKSTALLWTLKKRHLVPCDSTVLHNTLNGSKLGLTICASNRGCIVLSNRWDTGHNRDIIPISSSAIVVRRYEGCSCSGGLRKKGRIFWLDKYLAYLLALIPRPLIRNNGTAQWVGVVHHYYFTLWAHTIWVMTSFTNTVASLHFVFRFPFWPVTGARFHVRQHPWFPRVATSQVILTLSMLSQNSGIWTVYIEV